MFEQYTEEARRTLFFARYEASQQALADSIIARLDEWKQLLGE